MTEFCLSKEMSKTKGPIKVCSFVFNGRNEILQSAYSCKSCHPSNNSGNKYMCHNCSSNCHSTHLVFFSEIQRFVCSCGDRVNGCRLQIPPNQLETDAPLKEESENEEECCVICMDKKKDTMFYKCGHCSCCYDCALEYKHKNLGCPICRAVIEDICKIFWT